MKGLRDIMISMFANVGIVFDIITLNFRKTFIRLGLVSFVFIFEIFPFCVMQAHRTFGEASGMTTQSRLLIKFPVKVSTVESMLFMFGLYIHSSIQS